MAAMIASTIMLFVVGQFTDRVPLSFKNVVYIAFPIALLAAAKIWLSRPSVFSLRKHPGGLLSWLSNNNTLKLFAILAIGAGVFLVLASYKPAASGYYDFYARTSLQLPEGATWRRGWSIDPLGAAIGVVLVLLGALHLMGKFNASDKR